jgi:UDP-hydrolysing UDP-N-acetyl-D-glucosamine 2-epimerase
MIINKTKKRKVCFVIINRANYSRVRAVMNKVKNLKNFKLQIILASSPLLKKYGSLKELLLKDGFKVDRYFYTHIEGENLVTMSKSTGLALLELTSAFEDIRPDIVFITGDRYEILAAAIAASYMNIFVAHLQGGELSGSIDESIRHAVTKLAHLHLACTEKSKKNILQMGEKSQNVFNVGCPSVDLIKKINFKSKVDLNKYGYGIGYKVNLKLPYYVVLIHPVTTDYELNNRLITNTLKAVLKLNKQTIWLWPNNDAGADLITKKIRTFREKNINNKINFYVNFESDDYIKLIKDCECLIGNSSSGIREASFLKIPVVNIGDRQINRERGDNVIDEKNLTVETIYKSILKSSKIRMRKNSIYGNGKSALKICSILQKINLSIIKKFCVQK